MRRLLTALSLVLALPTLALASTGGAAAPDWLLALSLLAVGVLIGTGIVPAGAVGNELTAVTRRAFIPKCIVQIGKATPTLAGMLANAHAAQGGISSVTVPVQGTPFVTAQATDYSGNFTQPSVVQGITEADYNLKAVIVPIPFLGMEGILQQNAAIVPLIEARMNDAGNQIALYLSTQLWTNGTNGTINIDGFPLIAATTGTYGNIARATNTWWQGQTRTGTGPTRLTVLADIVSSTKNAGGEKPNIGVMGPGTWTGLAQNFLGLEQYVINSNSQYGERGGGARAAFTALLVADVPIYMDSDCPEGQLWLWNTRYDSFYIHESAAFTFTGFASTLPNMQLGYVGALVAVLEHVNVKPSTVCQVTGYTAISV